MKIAIIGGREYSNFTELEEVILKYFKNDISSITHIVSGGARGADSLGEKFADKYNIQKEIYLPNWELYGKRAGMLRNVDIIENSDLIFAFWDGKSPGTKHSIELATKNNKSIIVTLFDKVNAKQTNISNKEQVLKNVKQILDKIIDKKSI